MSLVKWVHPSLIRDQKLARDIPVIPLKDLAALVEGLQVTIAHSFVNTDEISAYRLACEHFLTQLEAHRKEGA